MYPHNFGNLGPFRIKIRIRIRFQVIGWIWNRIRINLDVTGQNVWNMSLSGSAIRIRIKVMRIIHPQHRLKWKSKSLYSMYGQKRFSYFVSFHLKRTDTCPGSVKKRKNRTLKQKTDFFFRHRHSRFDRPLLKVLSSEIDPAEIRLIR